MAVSRPTDGHAPATTESARTLKRRGLIAGAAALAAGVLATRANQDASAANGNSLIIGGDAAGSGTYQPGTAITWLAGQTGLGAKPALRVTNQTALTPTDTADGVQGYAAGAFNVGVRGRNDDTNGYGVRGDAGAGIGVVGVSTSGQGVYGTATSSVGVYGQSTSSYAVYGVATGATSGSVGVAGVTTTANSIGVLGAASGSNAAAGVFSGQVNVNGPLNVVGQMAASATGTHSVVGTSATAGAGGVLGQTSTANAFAIYGVSGNAGAYAGKFVGKVLVDGDFSVLGSKSAAVPHPDGTHRLLYCVEAPEAWFEDFGEAKVVAGRAAVTLDPDFAAVVDMSTLHVFLTPHDAEGNGLAVTARHATGFQVTERNKGTHSGSFSYRAVARRKDNPGVRLAKIAIPAGLPPPPAPQPYAVPKPPVVPTPPGAQRP